MTSKRLLVRSTDVPEGPSDGEPQRRHWTQCSRTPKLPTFRRPIETALAAAVAVVNEPHALSRAAIMHRLFQGIEDEASMRRGADAPTYDPAGRGLMTQGTRLLISWRNEVTLSSRSSPLGHSFCKEYSP